MALVDVSDSVITKLEVSFTKSQLINKPIIATARPK